MRPAAWTANDRDRTWSAPAGTRAATDFHRTLPGYAVTRITELPELAAQLGVARVVAKDETHRFGLPAFKALGASWAVHRAVEHGGPDRIVVTATDGNHGRAVARFARRAGHAARIFIPAGVTPQAVEAIRAEGAQVDVHPISYDDTVALAARYAGATDRAVLVQDTAWEGYEQIPGWIVEGYATILRELDGQLGTPPDAIIVPAGVGSLLQAVLAHYRAPGSEGATAVVSAEPTGAACIALSVQAGRPVSVPFGRTVMSGLNCGTPSSIAWPLISAGLDAAITVSDRQAVDAAHELADHGLEAGPCGGAALAAARVALTGADAAAHRSSLGLGPDSVLVLLVTEGPDANPLPDRGIDGSS